MKQRHLAVSIFCILPSTPTCEGALEIFHTHTSLWELPIKSSGNERFSISYKNIVQIKNVFGKKSEYRFQLLKKTGVTLDFQLKTVQLILYI